MDTGTATCGTAHLVLQKTTGRTERQRQTLSTSQLLWLQLILLINYLISSAAELPQQEPKL